MLIAKAAQGAGSSSRAPLPSETTCQPGEPSIPASRKSMIAGSQITEAELSQTHKQSSCY